MSPISRRSSAPEAAAGSQTATLTLLRPGLERVVAAAVETAESTFRGLVEHAPAALVIVDRDDPGASIVMINARAEVLFGYRREELVGQPVAVVLPTLFDTSGESVARVTSSNEPTNGGSNGVRAAALAARRKDGSAFPVEVGLSALETAQGLLVTAAIRDATEHHRIQEMLQEQIASLREQAELLTLAGDAVVVRDLRGVVTSWNGGAEALYGWSAKEVVGQTTSTFLHTEYPEPLPTVATALDEQGWWDGELRHVRRDGTTLVVESRQVLVRDAAGASAAILEVGRNVTERARVVNSLQSAHDVLVAQVDERTVDLARVTAALRAEVADRRRATKARRVADTRLTATLAELEQMQHHLIQQERLRALGEMASGIAHDFNNALSAVAGFSELLLLKPELAEDRPLRQRYLELIHAGVRDATAVVARLRQFYRPRAHEERHGSLNLDLLVEQVVNLTQPRWRDQAQAAGATIEVITHHGGVPPVNGDAGELRELVMNLIFNAVDAMPQGGTLTVRTRDEHDHAVLEVLDTGTGMSEDVRLHCLEPFFTTKEERGSGLGLSLVHSAVQRHGGSLDIVSVPNAGTTFIVRLPLASPAVTGDAPGELAPVGTPLRVLLVDDQEVVRAATAALLASDGHDVVGVGSGVKALEQVRRGRFDVLLIDRAMPGMGGDELAAALRRLAPATPVVMLTGFGSLMQAASDCPPGVSLVVSKPSTRVGLRKAFAQVLPSSTEPHAPAEKSFPTQ